MAKRATGKQPTNHDAALVRVSHIAAHMKVPLNGDQAVALAEFYVKDPKAESALVRAGKIAKAKGITLDGGDLLRMARFIAS